MFASEASRHLIPVRRGDVHRGGQRSHQHLRLRRPRGQGGHGQNQDGLGGRLARVAIPQTGFVLERPKGGQLLSNLNLNLQFRCKSRQAEMQVCEDFIYFKHLTSIKSH